MVQKLTFGACKLYNGDIQFGIACYEKYYQLPHKLYVAHNFVLCHAKINSESMIL